VPIELYQLQRVHRVNYLETPRVKSLEGEAVTEQAPRKCRPHQELDDDTYAGPLTAWSGSPSFFFARGGAGLVCERKGAVHAGQVPVGLEADATGLGMSLAEADLILLS